MPAHLSAGRAALRPEQFDPSNPENAAKLEVVELLIELATSIGCTLPELAVAFTVTHPAVTSAIVGPRTMEHLESSLRGASLTLDDASLDRIDEIVPPGTNMYEPNGGFPLPVLVDSARRRRPVEDRPAASPLRVRRPG
ncbi:MAG: aldo/keto reductase [Nocardioidaceae bacterium]